VLLPSGDQAGYRQTCGEMLQRKPGVRPYHVARACTLAADSVKDAGLPGKIAAGELRQNRQQFWSLTEQGALAYRAGRYDEAATLLEQSLKADDKPGRAALNWVNEKPRSSVAGCPEAMVESGFSPMAHGIRLSQDFSRYSASFCH
jgi:hypothetical protein